MTVKKKNTLHESSLLGISIEFMTLHGGYTPLHYHDVLEILYPLNGDMDLLVDRKSQRLLKRTLTVIESGQIHQVNTHDKYSMILCIHVSRKHLQSYLPDIELYRVKCDPLGYPEEKSDAYLKLSLLLSDLTRLYMTDSFTYDLEADGIVLQVMSILLRDFSTLTTPVAASAPYNHIDRIRTVISYVQEHYMDTVSLDEAASLLGYNKTYFCRFFKQNMGLSFLNYVNEIRLSHVYQDLMETDLPVSWIMEKNGFSNQKLFNRSFKELYGCTPSSVRK